MQARENGCSSFPLIMILKIIWIISNGYFQMPIPDCTWRAIKMLCKRTSQNITEISLKRFIQFGENVVNPVLFSEQLFSPHNRKAL